MQSMMCGLPRPAVIVLFSLVTAGAWGSWLVPLQLASRRDRSLELFHVALANLLVAGGVAWCQGGTARPGGAFFPAFLGGVVWAGSGLLALFAIRRLGSARAMGIWAPLNIVVNALWGVFLFRQPEFSSAAGKRALAGCVLAALGGALLGAALLG